MKNLAIVIVTGLTIMLSGCANQLFVGGMLLTSGVKAIAGNDPESLRIYHAKVREVLTREGIVDKERFSAGETQLLVALLQNKHAGFGGLVRRTSLNRAGFERAISALEERGYLVRYWEISEQGPYRVQLTDWSSKVCDAIAVALERNGLLGEKNLEVKGS